MVRDDKDIAARFAACMRAHRRRLETDPKYVAECKRRDAELKAYVNHLNYQAAERNASSINHLRLEGRTYRG